jgi:hypothetical protein
LASLRVSLDGRGSDQSDSVGCEPRHCASKDTLSEPNSSSRLQVYIRMATEPIDESLTVHEETKDFEFEMIEYPYNSDLHPPLRNPSPQRRS